jgi:hypothetical protein
MSFNDCNSGQLGVKELRGQVDCLQKELSEVQAHRESLKAELKQLKAHYRQYGLPPGRTSGFEAFLDLLHLVDDMPLDQFISKTYRMLSIMVDANHAPVPGPGKPAFVCLDGGQSNPGDCIRNQPDAMPGNTQKIVNQ